MQGELTRSTRDAGCGPVKKIQLEGETNPDELFDSDVVFLIVLVTFARQGAERLMSAESISFNQH